MGYVLGGLDWTGTALSQAFKAQEQILFMFSAVIFVVSVVLHMISIPEQPLVPSRGLRAQNEASARNSFFKDVGHVPPILDVIKEEEGIAPLAEEENDSIYEEAEANFLDVDRVRSKSDSVLAMPDSTIRLDSDLDSQLFLSEVHNFLPGNMEELDDVFKPVEDSIGSLSPSGGLPPIAERILFSETRNTASAEPTSNQQKNAASNDSHQKTQVLSLVTNKMHFTIIFFFIVLNIQPFISIPQKVKAANGVSVFLSGSDHSKAVKGHVSSTVPSRPSNGSVTSRPHSHTYYRRVGKAFSMFYHVWYLSLLNTTGTNNCLSFF